MKLLFHGNSLHYFALRVIKKDPFGGGRLRAAAKIQYFAISSYILVDSIFADKRDGDALKFMVRQFRSASVRNVVDCVATHFRGRGAVLNIMRGKECFAGYDVTNPDVKWTNRRIKDFIVDVCRIAELEMPPSTKIVILYVALEPLVDAFLRGETEEDDFFQLAISLASDDSMLFDECIDYVETRCPSLAVYLAARGEKSRQPAPAGSIFVPACAQPFNTALHELLLPDDVLLKGASDLRGFRSALVKSRYFAVEFHSTATEDGKPRFDLITFCLRTRIYNYTPRIFPDVLRPLVEILKEQPRFLFVHRWHLHKDRCRTELGWEPEPMDITDTVDVAKEIGIEPSLDKMAEKVVGGKFCRRGSNFTDVSLPSEVARQHRGIRATLIYEFVVQTRRLRESRDRGETGASGSRVLARRHDREQPRDQEMLSPDERNRHFSSHRYERERERAQTHAPTGSRHSRGNVRDRSRY